MPALLSNVDPDGLLEYSVVYTDRALNHMSRSFQGVMCGISGILKQVYAARSAVIGARHELCEDLATLLVEHAKNTLFDLGITEDDVLLRCHQGLLGEASVVDPKEAQWVIHRLAELLGWDCPDLASAP